MKPWKIYDITKEADKNTSRNSREGLPSFRPTYMPSTDNREHMTAAHQLSQIGTFGAGRGFSDNQPAQFGDQHGGSKGHIGKNLASSPYEVRRTDAQQQTDSPIYQTNYGFMDTASSIDPSKYSEHLNKLKNLAKKENDFSLMYAHLMSEYQQDQELCSAFEEFYLSAEDNDHSSMILSKKTLDNDIAKFIDSRTTVKQLASDAETNRQMIGLSKKDHDHIINEYWTDIAMNGLSDNGSDLEVKEGEQIDITEDVTSIRIINSNTSKDDNSRITGSNRNDASLTFPLHQQEELHQFQPNDAYTESSLNYLDPNRRQFTTSTTDLNIIQYQHDEATNTSHDQKPDCVDQQELITQLLDQGNFSAEQRTYLFHNNFTPLEGRALYTAFSKAYSESVKGKGYMTREKENFRSGVRSKIISLTEGYKLAP